MHGADDLDGMDGLDAEMPELAEPPATKWPRVIGIISVIYAAGGILCQVGVVASSFFSETLLKMGGMDIEMPPVLLAVNTVLGVVMSFVGLLLLFAAINLLRRRRSGVSLHKQWAVLRVVLVVAGVGIGIVLLPANIELQRSIQEASNERLREADRDDLVQEFSEDKVWRQTIITTGVTAGVVSVYPLFIGFYLSRRKIREEVETWT